MLTATRISKSHGAAVVLAEVSFTVGPRSRLGIVGPNGVGKTTLLRILAGIDPPDSGRVVRTPPDLTVGYLPQEPDGLPGETGRAYLERRSGVAAASAALEQAADALAAASTPGADGIDDAGARYADALDHWTRLGGADFDARVGQAATDAGLAEDRLDVCVADLSGGESSRTALTAILLSRHDVLLLDEPTNNLDFAGLDALERFATETRSALVVVSHDRDFLARTIERVLEIDDHARTATEYGGGWAGYLDARATARRHAEDAYAGYQSERSTLVSRHRTQRQWAETGATKEKRAPRDNDKAQRNWRVNRTEKQASKVRITEKAIARLDDRAVDKPWEGWDLHLDLAPLRGGSDVVARLRDAVVERGTFRLGPISLEIGRSERVAILGPNGSGKTTLLGALLGRLPLAAGERYLGPGVVVGELDQARAAFMGAGPLVDAFVSASGALPREARSLLAKFGLTAEHVARPALRLSPGERTRAVLALLMARQVNCLVLDEPTNHLDLPAIEQLEGALERYAGTVILVTHDRALLEHVTLTRTIEL